MNADQNDRLLDETIRRAVGSETARFDAADWMKKHREEIAFIRSRKSTTAPDSNCRERTWRKVMTNTRTKKIASIAAVIIFIIGLSIVLNIGGNQSLALAEVIRSCEQVDWAAGVISAPWGTAKEWWCPSKKVRAREFPDKISFTDFASGKTYEYDAESNTITITHSGEFPFESAGPMGMLKELVDMEKAEGGDVEKTRRHEDEKAIEVWTITGQEDGKETIRIILDVDRKLPIRAEVEYVDHPGHTVEFSYPDTGPQSVHDLGVPDSAKIIDKTETAPN
jgi:hypothetical protein